MILLNSWLFVSRISTCLPFLPGQLPHFPRKALASCCHLAARTDEELDQNIVDHQGSSTHTVHHTTTLNITQHPFTVSAIMHSCITTILLILTTLSSARYLDNYATNQWRTKDMEQVHGCLDSTWGNWFWSWGSSHVVYNDPNNLEFTYAITTGYDVYYPHTLYQLLRAHNCTVRTKSNMKESERCGWWSVGTVKVNGHRHGSIY